MAPHIWADAPVFLGEFDGFFVSCCLEYHGRCQQHGRNKQHRSHQTFEDVCLDPCNGIEDRIPAFDCIHLDLSQLVSFIPVTGFDLEGRRIHAAHLSFIPLNGPVHLCRGGCAGLLLLVRVEVADDSTLGAVDKGFNLGVVDDPVLVRSKGIGLGERGDLADGAAIVLAGGFLGGCLAAEVPFLKLRLGPQGFDLGGHDVWEAAWVQLISGETNQVLLEAIILALEGVVVHRHTLVIFEPSGEISSDEVIAGAALVSKHHLHINWGDLSEFLDGVGEEFGSVHESGKPASLVLLEIHEGEGGGDGKEDAADIRAVGPSEHFLDCLIPFVGTKLGGRFDIRAVVFDDCEAQEVRKAELEEVAILCSLCSDETLG